MYLYLQKCIFLNLLPTKIGLEQENPLTYSKISNA